MTRLQHGHTQLKLYYYATFILIPWRSTGNFLKIIDPRQPAWLLLDYDRRSEIKSNETGRWTVDKQIKPLTEKIILHLPSFLSLVHGVSEM